MQQKYPYLKVANDTFFVQMIWALWAFAIVIVITIVKNIIIAKTGADISGFLTSYSQTANVYMLVIGIISATGLLPYFINHGITRKDYFKGSTIGAIALSLTITILFIIIALVERAVIKMLNLSLQLDPSSGAGFASEAGDPLIVNLLLVIVDAPSALSAEGGLLMFLIFSLNLLTYYVIGWMISSAFIRLKVIGGLAFIVLSLLFFTGRNIIWGYNFGNIVSFAPVDVSPFISMLGTIVIIGISLYFVRLLTRKIVVKV